MANAKAEKTDAAGEDQSMEEILQSIRKIIAEESDPVPAADENPANDSDILELTDAIQDDGSVMHVNDDVLNNIDDVLSTPEAEPAPAAAQQPRREPPRVDTGDVGEGLVSAVSIAASAEAMKALKYNGNIGKLPFISGETVEGLVMHLLRPMLKEWLDVNLPTIVQQEVQREVRRITAALEQDD